jgi:hypothetical protein
VMDLKDKTTIVTIVAYNYLTQALALHDSVKCSDVRFVIVLVEPLGTCDLPANLEIYYAEEIVGEAFESMSFMYSIIELCTNIKPAVLKYFIEFSDFIYYIDPDIYFYSNPNLINKYFDASDVLITPHSLTPILDGLSPGEMEFMRTGVFNLGFIGLRRSENSIKFLDWWSDRCINYGLNETSSGLFVDQKFIDLSISFFPFISVSRNFGLNVGYWNLHERHLLQIDGEYFIGNDKLIFFHFSGLDPFNPDAISKHQNRYSLETRNDLINLFYNYSDKLVKFRQNVKKTEIPFCKFDNDVFVTNFARRFYWKHKSRYLSKDIFLSTSDLYFDLLKNGLISKYNKKIQSSFGSQSDLSKLGLQIFIFDIFLKFLLRLLGPARFWNLVRFAMQRFSTISKFYLW